MADTLTVEKLRARSKILYGVADFGIAMLTASLQFFLLFFLTDMLAINREGVRVLEIERLVMDWVEGAVEAAG